MQNNRIRDLREQKCLTRTELSELLGLSEYTISTWERGHHIPEKHYDKLVKVFGLPVDEIVWEESSDHREIDYIEDPSSFEPGKDIRPQIDCFCGNCDFWKQGSRLLFLCKCKKAEKYGFLTGRSFLCSHWHHNGLSYKDVLSVLPDDGALWKNLMAARRLRGLSIELVSSELGIDETVWKQYEKGVKAMPLQQLAQFSELCNIKADKLITDK